MSNRNVVVKERRKNEREKEVYWAKGKAERNSVHEEKWKGNLILLLEEYERRKQKRNRQLSSS